MRIQMPQVLPAACLATLLLLAAAMTCCNARGLQASAGSMEQQPEQHPAAAAAAAPPPDNIIPGRYIALVRPSCSAAAAAATDEPGAAAAAAAGTAPLLAAGTVYTAAAAVSSFQDRFADVISISHHYDSISEGFAFCINTPPAAAAAAGGGPDAAAAVAAAAAPVLQALQADPCIAVHPDRKVKRRSATNALQPGNAVPSGVSRIAAGKKDKVNGPAAIGIAIMDEGVGAHPELNIVLSIDCSSSVGGRCKRLARPRAGSEGHANLVAGVAAAKNGPEGGIVGVAPGSRLYSINVFGGNDGVSDVLAGLNWVRQFNANVTDTTGSGKIRVINMSFGDTSNKYSSTDGVSLIRNPAYPNCGAGMATVDPWHTAICQLAIDRENGAVAVVAVANEASDFNTGIPERYPESLAVTGMADSDGQPGGSGFYCKGGNWVKPGFYLTDHYGLYSNYITMPNPVAEAHTVAGPGTCIYSTSFGGSYKTETGCSFAAPHVSAVVALCFGEMTGARANRARFGACKSAWDEGGAPAVIQLIVQSREYRRTGEAGFFGDSDRPVTFDCSSSSSGKCQKHYGYLISAAAV